jgi:SAM-dependent methyltransferase
MAADEAFGDWADIYEALIDWPKRLAHEGPFYRRLFEQASVRRVVDVACGPGHHAALFHRWGLSVQGADVSPEMIQRARRQHGESASLEWVVRSFDQPIQVAEPFDAAICVGNSLALADEQETTGRAIGHMAAAVRPGGVIVVHVLNLWHLPDGPCRWQKCCRIPGLQGDLLVIKGVHRAGTSGYVNLLVTRLDSPPVLESQSVPFLGLQADTLEESARQAVCNRCNFWGGYSAQPYQRQESVDLIMAAVRA